MTTIKKLPTSVRPREKLTQQGVSNLDDSELIAILLGSGNKNRNVIEMSQYVLSSHPLDQLKDISYDQLIKLDGINISKACTLLATAELGRRMYFKTSTHTFITSPEDAYRRVQFLAQKRSEHVVALYLNARNEVIHEEVLTIGLVDASLIHAREVFAPAIEYRASYIILAHNHPSGSLEPSHEDIQSTSKLREGAAILGLQILDHLIVSKEGWISLKQQGYMS